MPHRIVTEVEIGATPEDVWAELVDLPRFNEWNPFMVSAAGEVEIGSKLEITMEPPGGSAMTFKPRVTDVARAARFEWLGSLGVRGLFDGRHQFDLAPTPNGTHLVQSEDFTGLLVPFLKKSLDTKTKAGFVAMNDALKRRAEMRSGAVGA